MTARYAVAVRLAPAGRDLGFDLNPETVVDLIWAQAVPDDRLDHVRTRGIGDMPALEIVLILSAEDVIDAVLRARRLYDRVLRSPLLRNSELEDLDAIALADVLP